MKVLWIVIGGIVIGALIGGFMLMQKKPSTQPVEMMPVANNQPTPTSAPTVEKYSNESGFSFEHQSSVTVKENELDATSYADLELTSEENPGTMTVKIVDTKLKDLAAWKKANKLSTSAITTDVQLGDLDALRIEDGTDLKLVAIGQSVLYTLEVPETNEYWTGVFDKVISTWVFELPQSPTVAPSKKSGSSAPASASDIYEEETIE